MKKSKAIRLLQDIGWHDGVFLSWSMDFKKRLNATFVFAVYENESDSKRHKKTVTFNGIDNLNINLDSVELLDNLTAGHIRDGYLKPHPVKDRHKFFLYLFDGMISFDFDGLSISAKTCSK